MTTPESPVDLLILGAGWTAAFLIPLCESINVSYAATTRHQVRTLQAKDKRIYFQFDPSSNDPTPFKTLPYAKTVLIVFPIKVEGGSTNLVKFYEETHEGAKGKTGFIQLGSTGIWDVDTLQIGAGTNWADRHTPFNTANDRANGEQELLSLSPASPTTVLNLCGLWGGDRSVKHWVGKVLPTKEALRNKGGIHMIHGLDVSRAILAVHRHFGRAAGQRWLLTDLRVYDWWDLASAWGETKSIEKHPNAEERGEGRGPQPKWVKELMDEEGVKALPRGVEKLGRGLDSREFWTKFGLEPVKGRLEE
ncbi:hypothetical protein EUX98_g2685 [Antrodiella citrinella]|uniref:Uncharacterized protein n=1 Tax=Antrodiella citrinella TaxID=2447956 RepID=A0A4S4MYE2_9APHY|nr:hypothetical protein EUX98_g2685 [Antrodiella citrinella]